MPANFAALADCCIQPETCKWSGTSDADTWSCCTDSEPCEELEGDCDSDVQCNGTLICGENNCISVNPNLDFDPAADCCIQPNSSKDHDQRNNFGQKIRLVPAVHYHLEVQANPKKIAQKTDAIFTIYGRNRIIP